MPKICGPPVLGLGHQRGDIRLDSSQIEAGEGFGIVEVLCHRVSGRRVLVQHREVKQAWPPQAVGHFEQDGVSVHFPGVHRTL
jgi:hypothetical protein